MGNNAIGYRRLAIGDWRLAMFSKESAEQSALFFVYIKNFSYLCSPKYSIFDIRL
jgi:hypothetical protein